MAIRSIVQWLLVSGVCMSSACSGVTSTSRTRESPGKVTPARVAVYSARSIVPNGHHEPAPLIPGRIASIYGEHLGPETPCTGPADPLRRETPNPLRPNQTLIETQVFPEKLCDTQVRVGGVPAGLLYVSAGQINFKVPQQTPVSGTTEVQVLCKNQPGPAVLVPLTNAPATHSAEQLAAEIWSGLQTVKWRRAYQTATPGSPNGCRTVPVHPDLRRGLYGHSYYCAQPATAVIAETFYYPIDYLQPKNLLLRADFRLAYDYPELSAEVEQLLIQRLTSAYGPGTVPDRLMIEISASFPKPGMSWRVGDVTVFLHCNRNYVAPAGIREGVQVIAIHREVLEERQRNLEVQEAIRTSSTLSHPVAQDELEKELGQRYLRSSKHPETESGRVRAELDTQTALLRLLRDTSEGGRDRRAAILVAADDLAVRLGSLLVTRSVTNGRETLAEAPGAGAIRLQLASYDVRYAGIGHYSGDLEYDRSLLRRAWTQFPDTAWGQRAFLWLQYGCSVPGFDCSGPNCFLTVIKQGENFLRDYPDTPFRTAQIYHLALANETWWSLSQAVPNDPTARGAHVDKHSGDRARKRAIELYEELLRTAPRTPEARSGQLSLPRLKLGLSTGERTFFCFSC